MITGAGVVAVPAGGVDGVALDVKPVVGVAPDVEPVGGEAGTAGGVCAGSE